MWQVNLIKGIVNGFKNAGIGKSIVKRAPYIARSIMSKGNGQLRTVVKGFGTSTWTAEDVAKSAKQNSGSFRKIIAGFTGKKGQYKLTAPSAMSRIKFFPCIRRAFSRHFVANANTSRNVVSGFGTSTTKAIKVNKAVPSTQPVQMVQDRRIVVQGFGGNSENPIYKDIELKPSTPRTVVKGFVA